MIKKEKRHPWSWIPTLYFAEGIPYIIVMTVSVVMYKDLGISNTDIALFTSWLYLPWVIKPLWSPVVDIVKTKRLWTVSMQGLLAIGFIGIAFTLSLPITSFFWPSIIFLALMALASATHDIAADGFYLLALDKDQQSFFVGIRSTFYRAATLFGNGVLVFMAGYFTKEYFNGEAEPAWMIVFGVAAALFFLFFIYHKIMLPYPVEDAPRVEEGKDKIKEFFLAFAEFFKQKKIGLILFFLLVFRLPEAQLVKMVAPFLKDPVLKQGMGLSNEQFAIVYGTAGILALTVGGILGGIAISRHGLKRWLWPMLLAMHLPIIAFWYLASSPPHDIFIIGVAVVVEQFGYGFGFAAYMVYMMYVSDNKYKTSSYAICTGFMALGMMIPGMWSGWLEETVGYENFFLIVLLTAIPSFFATWLVPLDKDFGKKVR
ncbi:AmpG family muropeptide MFS transporter [Ignavibacteriales bacterium]